MGHLIRFKENPWRSAAQHIDQIIKLAINDTLFYCDYEGKMGDDCRLTTNYVVMFEHSCQTLSWLLLALLWAGGHPHQFAGQVVLTLLKRLKEGKPHHYGQKAGRLLGVWQALLGNEELGLLKTNGSSWAALQTYFLQH